VHVIDGLGPGGAEHNLANLLVAGDRRAFDHHVVALYRDDTLASRLREVGAAVSVLGGRGPRDAPRVLLRLRSVIRNADPDLVHTQLVMSDILGRAAVLLNARRPVLSTLQNRPYDPVAVGTEIPTAFLSAAIRRADRWLGAWTKTRYVAVSESVRLSYIRELGIAPERIEVVYNSVDISQFRKKDASPAERKARRAALGLSDAPLLLNVARHTRQKGLLDLVAAMDSVPVRTTGAHLLLVGTGPDTPRIRARIGALQLDSAISLLGRRFDVRELMELCDVFVLPSIYEGLPLALIEALASGLPVVASDLAEIREVTTGDGARLVPPGRPELLAQAIAGLIAAPQTGQGLAREGRLQVERRFDLDKNVLRFEAILRETARSRPST
jgi:glycosyltransferase involved in cell wall biosynthesis